MDKVTKSDLARQYIEKYTKIGKDNGIGYSKTWIAEVLSKDYPSLFKDTEDARMIIRRVCGTAGIQKRKNISNYQIFADMFALVPDSIRETNPDPFVMPLGYKKTLWIADLHSKFMDRKSFEIAVNRAISEKCDSVIINGDFMDFYGDSKFDKNPMVYEKFKEEREWGVSILQLLQNTLGYVVVKKGNHDMRRELHIQRLSSKMPELIGLSSYEDYLFFEGTGVKFVQEYQHIEYGKLFGIHGHEYQGGGGVHVAHNRLHKTFDNTISAHSHRAQSVINTKINGDVIGSWSLGCMCNLNPAYNPKNNWSNGFAITTKDDSGDFEVENKVISRGKIFSI